MKELLIKSRTGTIALPKIILGSTYFGTGVDVKTAYSLMDAYAELGGTCIDTASVYGDWEDRGEPISEQIIGKWLKKARLGSEIKIMTKGAHFRMKTPDISRVSAACIAEDIEKSLRNLQLDTIDVYFLHRDNPEVPVSEIMPLLHSFVISGKIKAIGASNWSMERILEANSFAEQNNLTPFTISEIQWSLAKITPEYNVFENLPYMNDSEYEKYLAAGIPVAAWSSQASGIVSRVINNGMDSITEDLRNKYCNDITLRRIENVRRICKETGISPTQASLGYITCNPLAASAIIGPSSIEHLKDSLTAADLDLNADIIEQLVK